jgi:hypothetical protein
MFICSKCRTFIAKAIQFYRQGTEQPQTRVLLTELMSTEDATSAGVCLYYISDKVRTFSFETYAKWGLQWTDTVTGIHKNDH